MYEHLETYGHNYHRLLMLVPDLCVYSGCTCLRVAECVELDMHVCEQTKYTTALCFVLRFKGFPRWFPDVILDIRAYHDAQVTEVLAFQKQRDFRAHYSYRYPHLIGRKEKRRVNEFLGKCLDFCLSQRQAEVLAEDSGR